MGSRYRDNLQFSPPLSSVDNESAWRRLVVPPFGRVGVRTADGKLFRFLSTQDEKKHTLHLENWRNDHFADLPYQQLSQEHLVLTGTVDGKPVELYFHRYNPDQFLLTTRGFHWISENPYNL